MLGNRTRSPIAISRYRAASTSQNAAAANVRASSDAAVVEDQVGTINSTIGRQQDQINDLGVRVGDLEDIP
ncbi:hypothetical protein VH570_14285 [Sphingobium sp. HT1-2]|uniref:hypothetical protein n=1 Tax=Sphingobium sp. HT1-2 TaxID=3111640 RepID=UPI003C0325FF